MRRAVVWLLLVLLMCSTEALADPFSEPRAYERARADVLANRHESALKILRVEVKARPNDYRSWFLIGVASAHLKRYHQAIEAFRHVINIKPNLSEPHDNLAVIYNELDDVKAAVVELEHSLKKNPGNAVAEENLADLYLKLAVKNYRTALARNPNQQLEERYKRLLQVRSSAPTPSSTARLQQRTPISEREVVVEKDTIRILSAPVTEPEQPMIVEIPEQKKPEKQLSAQQRKQQVRKAVEAWRSAWSARNLEKYFSSYTPDFEPPERFSSQADWRAYKDRVIRSKEFIQVEISDVQVVIEEGGDVATVKFFQKFRSNSYNGDQFKQLKMKMEDKIWKIVKEESAS